MAKVSKVRKSFYLRGEGENAGKGKRKPLPVLSGHMR